MFFKNFFNRIYIDSKKGLLTPTLPENIIKFKSNPLIRILRVLGGLSILVLLGNNKYSYSLPIYVLYFLWLVGFLFLVYHIVISYYRFVNIKKILKSDKLDVRNSPLDH